LSGSLDHILLDAVKRMAPGRDETGLLWDRLVLPSTRCRFRLEGVVGQRSILWAWGGLLMASILTVLRFVRDASLTPSVGQGSRKEVPMGHKAHRLRLFRGAMFETLSAIGASYAAGALPT
jgi:hypothetical protein